MADIELLSTLPDPPLPTDAEDVFDAKAGATLTAQQKMVNVDINGKLVPQINSATAQITVDKNAAAASALTATQQAAIASGAGGAAAAQVALATAAANNAAASATAAESAPGSIGNLALMHAVALSF
ncbi:hypothetical protein AABC73_14800 [Pseudomonas sp. G.S.17]|uniref:hypothetical protein n=1 Tax=Pseudomonas sp. G.S.17 TaxID=3137451 RepID=UPI00311C8DAB